MRGRTARRGSLPAVAVLVAVLALPASAAAEIYRGKSAQGKPVKLQTGPDQEIRGFSIKWESSNCRRRGARLLPTGSSSAAPFDRSKPGSFVDRGQYRVKFTDARVRFVVSIRGRQQSPDRWTGTFKAKAFLKLDEGGRDVCKLRRIAWAANS